MAGSPRTLAEPVLERLPFVDYIRFAVVCPTWRSIQRGHRLRHAPHPPPVANQLPWLVPLHLNDPHREPEFHNLLDRKSYRLPIPSSLRDSRCLASCRGWLLLLEDNGGMTPTPTSKQPCLFNPITADQILLLLISLIPWRRAIGAMSTTPTDPNCVVLLVIDCCAFLYRPNDHCAADWTIIRLTPIQRVFGGSAIYCGNKFYCSFESADELYVINPFLQKEASPLVMRYPSEASTDACRISLHEIGGELFSVQTLFGPHQMLFGPGLIKWFRVFKSDLSGQEWVRVETLGEHVLFHYDACSVLLLAADVGCKRNSIYALKQFRCEGRIRDDFLTWGVFDLGAGGWTEEDTLTDRYFGPWFQPTLDSANPAKSSG